jgi:glycosyltransferase involved in cell wall biosynthesis
MSAASSGKPFISLVIPCYNEQEVINLCQQRIAAVIGNLHGCDFEIVYINDGSSDNTAPLLAAIAAVDPRVRILTLSRNFGKEAALTAGLDHAKGCAAIVLDADLQDPPELIPELLRLWQESGADVVYGQRTRRNGETMMKKASAAAFYKLMNKISGKVNIPVNTGDFRLINRRGLDALKTLRERHRFMKGLFAWIGFTQVAMPYVRQPRAGGRTKWDYLSLYNLSLEGITGFSLMPLRIATLAGLAVSVFSFLFGTYIILRTLIWGNPVPGYPSLMVMISFLSGIQLLTIGVLGEYIGRIFNETKKRPLYFIDTITEYNYQNPLENKPLL